MSAARLYPIAPIDCPDAGLLLLKVQREIFGARKSLIPLPLWLLVHGADTVAVLQQLADKVSTDEAAGARYEYRFIHGFRKERGSATTRESRSNWQERKSKRDRTLGRTKSISISRGETDGSNSCDIAIQASGNLLFEGG
jgi:hypothetical protein